MAFAALLICASVPLLGGRLGRLASIRFRYPWVIVAALVAQILISNVIPHGPRWVLVPLHLASYVAAAVVLWANRRLPGLPVIGLGAFVNAAVIALNGGTLPASARALAAVGWSTEAGAFANSGVRKHPVLPWLGDIVATPSWLPFRNVMSVGDLLILIGLFILVHWVGQSQLARNTARASATARRLPARCQRWPRWVKTSPTPPAP